MRGKFILLIVILCAGGVLHSQTITVDSPAGGATWCIGQPQTITWSCSGTTVRRVTIDLRSGSSTVLVISPETANTGSFPWTIPTSVTPGTYQVRVRLWSSPIGGQSRSFTVSACGTPLPPTRPAIVVTSPDAGATWNNGTGYTIRWTPTGTMNANVRVQLFQGAASMLEISPSTANNGSLPWTIPATVAAGSYFVRVSTVDNLVRGDSRSFNIAALMYMSNNIAPVNVLIPDPCRDNQHANTDLTLENILFRIDPTNPNIYHYSFRIRNLGPRCIKTLSWKIVTNERSKACLLRQPMGSFDASGGEYVLKAGEYKSINGKIVKDVDIQTCVLDLSTNEAYALVKIVIDPNNDVIETNEHNNESLGTECPGSWRVGSTSDGYFKLFFNYEGD